MIHIKRATPDDSHIIADIGKTSFLESHRHSASAADINSYVDRKYTTDAVNRELEDPHNIYHLIYYGIQPAGYSKIILNAENSFVPDKNITILDRLYLLKDYYGLNLGQKLLEHNIDISRSAGQTGMWLYTWIENLRAVSFYKRNGFKIIGSADFKISDTHSNPNHIMYLKY